ncbi:MAG: hypothetical protein AAF703_12020 [Cyanobacteria bacterium P01_D01_bin.105]
MNDAQLSALVNQAVAEIFGSSIRTRSTVAHRDKWISLSQAWEPLGYPSYNSLYKDIHSGLFRKGKEVRDRRKPGARIARWQINLAAAEKRLLEEPAKRRAV